jgi:hypothetical protein
MRFWRIRWNMPKGAVTQIIVVLWKYGICLPEAELNG